MGEFCLPPSLRVQLPASVIRAAGGDDGDTTEEQEQEGGSHQTTQPDGGGAGYNGDEPIMRGCDVQ